MAALIGLRLNHPRPPLQPHRQMGRPLDLRCSSGLPPCLPTTTCWLYNPYPAERVASGEIEFSWPILRLESVATIRFAFCFRLCPSQADVPIWSCEGDTPLVVKQPNTLIEAVAPAAAMPPPRVRHGLLMTTGHNVYSSCCSRGWFSERIGREGLIIAQTRMDGGTFFNCLCLLCCRNASWETCLGTCSYDARHCARYRGTGRARTPDDCRCWYPLLGLVALDAHSGQSHALVVRS